MNVHEPERLFAVDVVRQLREVGYVALWAGGCVRDLLRGRTPADFDVATNATPEQVRALFGKRRTLAVGESFGVVIVLGPQNAAGTIQVEVATFRKEGPYLDGRRPEHVSFCTAEEDAQRRDFTINGMFYDPLTESIHDYVGGEADLQRGIVRAIGDPRARMTEDKLRMLRAVRFAAVFEFELASETADAVREMAHQIQVVSWERITQEFRKMLLSPHRRRALSLCVQLGLLAEILPELQETISLDVPEARQSSVPSFLVTLNAIEQIQQPNFALAMGVMLREVPLGESRKARDVASKGTVEAICRRMKLSNEERDRIVWLVEHQLALSAPDSLTLAELKRLLVHSGAADLLAFTTVMRKVQGLDDSPTRFVQDFLARYTREQLDPPPLLTGADLIAQGLRPGPKFRELLDLVRTAQLNERISTPAEALTLAGLDPAENDVGGP